jgi:hypothetical protein
MIEECATGTHGKKVTLLSMTIFPRYIQEAHLKRVSIGSYGAFILIKQYFCVVISLTLYYLAPGAKSLTMMRP